MQSVKVNCLCCCCCCAAAIELASRLGGAEKAYQLPSVPSGRALSKMEHLPSPHIADAPHVGRSTSGRSYEPDVRVGGAAADTLRARTRSGTPLDGEKQLSGVGGTSLRMHAHNSTEKGKPIELVRTASGRMVEMVRTDSGRLVELHHPLDRHSYRIGEGKTMSGRHLLPMDRTASGRYTVRTESGRYMTDLELIELNRARRVSGRPALKHVVVVGTNVPEGGDADPLTAAPSSLEVGLSPEGEVTLEEEAILSVPVAILMLAGMAVLIAVHCEFLTEAIQEFGEMTHLSQPFIGEPVISMLRDFHTAQHSTKLPGRGPSPDLQVGLRTKGLHTWRSWLSVADAAMCGAASHPHILALPWWPFQV